MGNRSITVDHYAKWFFHVFVDADKSSPTYTQIMRFYSPYAGFAVYHGWEFESPSIKFPTVWNDTLPEKGPTKCMNPQNAPDICDSYWPKTGSTGYSSKIPTGLSIFPSAFERLALLNQA